MISVQVSGLPSQEEKKKEKEREERKPNKIWKMRRKGTTGGEVET